MSSRSPSSSPVGRKRKRESSEERHSDKSSPAAHRTPSTGTSQGVRGLGGYVSSKSKILTHKDDFSSNSSEDERERDQLDPEAFRRKKLKKVDIDNPFSTFEQQTRNKKRYVIPSSFAKDNWLKMRGMDESGKFMAEQDSKPDAWKDVSKSDTLVRKFSGEIFGESKLDDGLYSIVEYDMPEDRDLVKSQRRMGSIGHLSLRALDNFGRLYKLLGEFVSSNLGPPEKENPDWTEGSDLPRLCYSEAQMETWSDFQEILKELQVDVAEPISNISRISASAFTLALDARREKVLAVVKKSNSKAANAISRIAPSASSLFGGDHAQLEKVVKLTRDLSSSSNRQNFTNQKNDSGKSFSHGHSKKRGSNKSSDRSDRSGKEISKKFRGNAFRGKGK